MIFLTLSRLRLCFFLSLWSPSLLSAGEILFHSPHGPWWVYRYDNGFICLVSTPPPSPLQQSCIDPLHPDKVVMPYIKLALGSLYLNPKPTNILLLGFGGGSLVKILAQLLPEAKITAVEIEPLLFTLAERYFSVPTHSKIHFVTEDGAAFIHKSTETYDLIILDAFESASCAPVAFREKAFVQALKERLSPQGVLAINTLNNCAAHQEEERLYKDTFGSFYKLAGGLNEVLLMTKAPLPSVAFLTEMATQWRAEFTVLDIETEWLLSYFQKHM